MIDFMLIGLPRSGTTWAANWLTTDQVHCVHDPLYTTHYLDWDSDRTRFPADCRVRGVSCTGIWRWADWLNQHPSRKVVLHRDPAEVSRSMQAIGLPPLEEGAYNTLKSIKGRHIAYNDLFDSEAARDIWEYLTGLPFNKLRHQELAKIEMQPKFSGLSIGHDVTRQLMQELLRISSSI